MKRNELELAALTFTGNFCNKCALYVFGTLYKAGNQCNVDFSNIKIPLIETKLACLSKNYYFPLIVLIKSYLLIDQVYPSIT